MNIEANIDPNLGSYSKQTQLLGFQSLQVRPRGQAQVTCNMHSGDILRGHFTVSGGNDDIEFCINDPVGNSLIHKDKVHKRHVFTCRAVFDGIHVIYFDNGISWLTTKYVLINYRVE